MHGWSVKWLHHCTPPLLRNSEVLKLDNNPGWSKACTGGSNSLKMERRKWYIGIFNYITNQKEQCGINSSFCRATTQNSLIKFSSGSCQPIRGHGFMTSSLKAQNQIFNTTSGDLNYTTPSIDIVKTTYDSGGDPLCPELLKPADIRLAERPLCGPTGPRSTRVSRPERLRPSTSCRPGCRPARSGWAPLGWHTGGKI